MRPHSTPQGPLGLCGSRFQIDAWALKYKDALTLADAVRIALDGYSGTVAGTVIQCITLDNSRDFYEDDPEQYRVSRDYMIWHQESIGTN